MSAVNQVREYIKSMPPGQPFLSNELRALATTENIRQILNRLLKAGELTRVGRGAFVKPNNISSLGEVLPPAEEIAKMVAKSTGETIHIQGAEAARQLGLTTQVPMKSIFYTNGNTRTIKVANRTIHLKHINPSRLIRPGTIPGLVISALNYLGKENVTTETLEIIRGRISVEDFNDLLTLVSQMPAWMSNVFYSYTKGNVS